MKALYLTLCVLLLAACGPSPEELTATAVMAQAQTETAAPTFTPTFTPTLTSTPTLTPTPTLTSTPTITPTFTPSPTPDLPKVYGNVQVVIVPIADDAVAPRQPMGLTMILSPAAGGDEIRVEDIDPYGNFTAYLAPGEYEVQALVLTSPDLSSDPVSVVTNGPTFTVRSEPCSFAGTFTFTTVRLSPGSPGEQITQLQKVSNGQAGTFILLETGSLLPPLGVVKGAGTCPEPAPALAQGYSWAFLPEISLALPVWSDWNFKKEQDQTTNAYFVSQENIDTDGTFNTGLSIIVLHDKSKNAAQIAKGMPATMLAQTQITSASEVTKRTEGNLTFYEFQYEASFSTYDATVYNRIVANTATNTLYIITFESPHAQWEEAWKIGQVMIEQMQFLK